MNPRRYAWIVGAILILGWILAFPLRDVLERMVIIPAAFLLWALGLFYRAMPQLVWWIIAVIVILVMLLGSLAPGERFTRLYPLKRPAVPGQVEELARAIRKTRDGVYFKWMVANRLGKLAYNMLVQREGESSRSVFSPLVGADWQPSQHLRSYLETGLHGSFSDYPQLDRWGRRPSSPLDLEIEEVLQFLESQMEARHDGHR